ncbi:MAG TPA: Wzz/FepE/Etk N-terminal domain-containing protein, partial [Chitinophagaceae bacterium]|nr:Wzz/FepE/Etk N-terminal domain-containing protein [Chitinophagaceae bacterium]
MEDKREDSYSLTELFDSLLSYTTYLRRKWLTMVLIISVTVSAGILYYFIQKPKYEASCTFILEEKQSGLGSLSGLASQFGFDFGGNSGGSLFAGDNILEILKSKTIIRTVLLSGVDSNSGKKLIDQFIELKGWDKDWEDNPRLKGINFSTAGTGTQHLSLQQDSVLGVAHKALVEKHIVVERMIKKGSLVRVSVISANEIFSKLMA